MKTKSTPATNSNLETVSLSFSAEAGLGAPIITSGYATNGNRYIPFSSNSKRYNTQNTYPQQLAKLVLESPTHGAAINIKSMLTKGLGFDKESLSRNVKKRMMRMNSKGQTIDDILEQVAKDYVTFGGFALKVIWQQDGKINSVERIHFTDVRCGEPDENGDIKYYVISNNWDLQMPTRFQKTYSLPVFNPDIFDEEIPTLNGIPQLTEEQIANGEQIIYFYKESSSPATNGMYFYPVPDYAAGIDCIMQEIDINIANKSLINNGLGGKTVINIPQMPTDEEVKRNYVNNTIRNFTRAENNGGLIINFGEDVDRLPTYTTLAPLEADTYNNVHEIVIQTIVTAHNIPGILLNLRNGGTWSNTADEMEQAFLIFNKTKIAAYQQDIERMFNTLFFYMGYDVELQIIPFTINTPQDVTSDEVVDDSKQVDNTTNTETTSLDSE